MKRRMLSLLLAAALICALVPQFTQSARALSNIGGMLDWRFDESTGTLIITGCGYMADFEAERYDPQTNLTYPVTPWEVYAPLVTSVVLPDGLLSIGINAFFNFTNLKSITIPNTVTWIGRGAFRDCANLSEIVIPNSVTYIGGSAFSGCKGLQSFSIPYGTLHIFEATFRGCSSLQRVTIPNSVVDIRREAFYGCSNLANISIPDSVEWVEEKAFLDTAYYNNAANWTNDLLYLGKWLIAAKYGISNVSVRPGTVGIADYTFAHQRSLTSITLPEGLKIIGCMAFYACYSLYNVNIPSSVKRIGILAFDDTAIYHNSKYWEGPILYLGKWLITAGETEADYHITIRPDTQGIADSAFRNCPNITLTSIMLPAGLQSIGGLAFAGCESITSFVLPESVSVIWDEAFEWNGHLKSVVVLNKNCFISDAPYLFGSSSSMTVVGYPGSTAEAYARKYGYAFKSVEELSFVDVDASSYYSAPAEWALGQNITTGTSPHIFNANMVCTRAQVVTFLWRANGCPEPEKTENPFADVKEGAYYYKAVLWAAEKGITTGTGETTFSPDSGCTRGQVVTFLWRAEGQPEPTNTENPFKDVADGQYYCKAVLWAAGKDITKGTSADHFSPDSICTRAQIVTFLYRGLGQQLSPSQAV